MSPLYIHSSGVPRGWTPLPKFRSFYKAEPNSHLSEKYIRNNLIRIEFRPFVNWAEHLTRGYRPKIPVLSALCTQLNLLTPPPPRKNPGYATDTSCNVGEGEHQFKHENPSLALNDKSVRLFRYIHTVHKYCLIFIIVPTNAHIYSKVKDKVHLITVHEGPEGEYRYSSMLPLTSALGGVGSYRHAPAALPPGNTRYPLYRRLDGSQDRSGWVRKISPPPRSDPRTVQHVASRYTDCAIPAHQIYTVQNYFTNAPACSLLLHHLRRRGGETCRSICYIILHCIWYKDSLRTSL
jgi:hypothetical protein